MLQGGACCSWALMEAIHKMDECPLLMAKEDAEHVSALLKQSLVPWHGMCMACREAGVARWEFRPKHHYLEHLADCVLRTCINPRHLSCFQDESYLGSVKRIATMCHSATAILRVFQRLILNLGQRFQDCREGQSCIRREL